MLIKKRPYSLDKDTITIDLTSDRPDWILSAYGPGRDAPRQLLEGPNAEISPEEVRLRYYNLSNQGDVQCAIEEFEGLTRQAEQHITSTLAHLDKAIDYVLQGAHDHPNRVDVINASTNADPRSTGASTWIIQQQALSSTTGSDQCRHSPVHQSSWSTTAVESNDGNSDISKGPISVFANLRKIPQSIELIQANDIVTRETTMFNPTVHTHSAISPSNLSKLPNPRQDKHKLEAPNKLRFSGDPPDFGKPQILPFEYNEDELSAEYEHLSLNGRFKSRIPELPPRRAWVNWRF